MNVLERRRGKHEVTFALVAILETRIGRAATLRDER